jgi:hypothetical protein
MADLPYGNPLPPDFEDGKPLTAAQFNAVKNYWVTDVLPEYDPDDPDSVEIQDGDVVFVIGDEPVEPPAPSEEFVFEYTGTVETITVPEYANYMTVTLSGAQGGREHWGSYGKLGGTVTATRPISPGDTLYLHVGGMGETAPEKAYDDVPIGDGNANLGGYNGGGNGGYAQYNGENLAGAGGGGCTDIRLNTNNLASRIIVAGAGGGGGSGTPGGGGGLVGQSSTASWDVSTYTVDGGTQSAGGRGCYGGGAFAAGNPGGLGQGGSAPSAGSGNVYYSNPAGGGGGAGYYGGGSGAHRLALIDGTYYYSSGMAGAGGSSYTDSLCTDVTHTQGDHEKHGQALIKFFAGIDSTLDEGMGSDGAYIPPQPFASWVLTDEGTWEPPAPLPADGKQYRWDEDSVSWVEEEGNG